MNIGESKNILIDTVSDLKLYDWLLNTLNQLITDSTEQVATSKSLLANQALQRLARLSHDISHSEDEACLFRNNGREGIIASWEKANPQAMIDWLNGNRPDFTETPPVTLFNNFRQAIGKIDQTLIRVDCHLRLHVMLPPSPSAMLRMPIPNLLSYTPPVIPYKK